MAISPIALILRLVKGTPLTAQENDDNLTALKTASEELDLNKAEASAVSNVDNTSDLDKPVSTATQTALDLKADASSVSNVDNTSDLDKPVSTATQTALDLKEDTANKGQVNGYASLDASGLVPSTQLPSYVDDVIEVATYADLPVTGESGKIYIVVADETDTGSPTNTYRWATTVYVRITDTLSADEVKSLYESNADTNAFTDALLSKLNGIEALAEVNNISDANALDLTDSGESTLHYHAADRDRANHTGTQLAATISDFSTAADARIAAASIDALSDVDTTTTSPTGGDALIWDGSKWVPSVPNAAAVANTPQRNTVQLSAAGALVENGTAVDVPSGSVVSFATGKNGTNGNVDKLATTDAHSGITLTASSTNYIYFDYLTATTVTVGATTTNVAEGFWDKYTETQSQFKTRIGQTADYYDANEGVMYNSSDVAIERAYVGECEADGSGLLVASSLVNYGENKARFGDVVIFNGLDLGQSMIDVLTSRSVDTPVLNDTGSTIFVAVTFEAATSSGVLQYRIEIDSTIIAQITLDGSDTYIERAPYVFPVPNGSSYAITNVTGVALYWYEFKQG